MIDVVIVGAGPAGALAALVLARAGVRVRVFDRAKFPRAKLCGDTLNPGACRMLAGHVPLDSLLRHARPIAGMLLTGPGGVAVRGSYGNGDVGYAIERRILDGWLLEQAVRAGADVEQECLVEDASVDNGLVTGVHVRRHGQPRVRERARLVIAADGRHSRLAFALGLARHPVKPRRWAIGAYFEGVGDLSDAGEMHVRRGHYIGVAPMFSGVANACLVVPHEDHTPAWPDAASMLTSFLARDDRLAPRFSAARMVDAPSILGPMAVDVPQPGVPGLLLAGDAAGFIDPMTGDGMTFALRGSAMAARVALDVLGGRLPRERAVEHLARTRRRAFAAKWRFNRSIRRLVGSPSAVSGAASAARVWPSAFRAMIRYAGDVD